MLPPNLHRLERGGRVVLGLGLVGAAAAFLGSTAAIVAAVVGVVLLATGSVGSCPAYTLVGFSTAEE